MEKKPKKVWIKDFFVYNKRHHWFIMPTFVFFYNKETFLETGVDIRDANAGAAFTDICRL